MERGCNIKIKNWKIIKAGNYNIANVSNEIDQGKRGKIFTSFIYLQKLKNLL